MLNSFFKLQHCTLWGNTNRNESVCLTYLYKTQGIAHSAEAVQHTEKDGEKGQDWN